MNSLFLKTVMRFLLPLLIMFAFFILIRGHNEPGGGFVGGLVAAAALTVYAIAEGIDRAREVLLFKPIQYIGIGLLLAFIAGVLPLFDGKMFLTGMWYPYELSVLGKVGTAFIFDTGVFLVVVGVTSTIVLTLAEDAAQEAH